MELFIISTILLTLLTTVCILWIQSKKNARALHDGCQPPAKYRHTDPLFGLDYLFKIQLTVEPVVQAFKIYGKTFQTKTLIQTAAPDNIRACSTGKEWGVEPVRFRGLEPFCGRGFLSSDGAVWQHSRTLVKSSFDRANATDFSVLGAAVDDLLARVPMDHSTVDVQPLLYDMFFRTSMHFLMGLSVKGTTKEQNEGPMDSGSFIKNFHEALMGAQIRIGLNLVIGPLAFWLPKASWVKTCKSSQDFVDFYIQKALRQTEDEQWNEETTGPGISTRSMLHNLTKQTDDVTEVRDQILQGMMASLDTTSALISNTLWLLSRHQPYWKKLREEAISGEAASLTYDALSSSQLLRHLLFESLRMYPIFPGLGRTALVDTKLPTGGGPTGQSPIFIPAGTMLECSFFTLHRDVEVFGENVEEFDPSRWDTIQPDTWEFLPFGSGPRSCLGQQKALVEASYILVRIAQRFENLESRDDRPWKGEKKLTCSNANGCKIGLF